VNALNEFESSLPRYYNEGPESLNDDERDEELRNLQEGKVICYLLLIFKSI
jgi:hypothetical protein